MESQDYKTKGNEEFKKGNYQAAIAHYTEGLLEEETEQLYGNRAACYLNLGKYKESLDDWRKALAIQPDYIKVTKRLVQWLIALDQSSEAKIKLEEAVKENAKNKKLLIDEIKKVKEIDEIQEAIMKAKNNENWSTMLYFINQKMVYWPGSESLMLDKLECLMETKNQTEATKYSKQLFDSLNHNPRFLYLRGLCLVNEGNLDMGKKFFVQALKNDPDFLTCQKALKKVKKTETMKKEASEFFKSGEYESAVKGFTEWLELFPNNKAYNSAIYLNRALCYNKLKKHDNALNDLNSAIECNEDYAKAYVKRGEINIEIENYEEAVRDFEKAKQISPHEFNIQQKSKDAKIKLKQSKRKDYYKILNITKDASQDQIKKAYRKLALKWHPDKNSGSEEQKAEADKMFKDIGEAYALLSDPQKRERYDSGMDLEDIENGGGFHSHAGGIDPTQIFQMFFGGDGGMGGGGMPFFNMGSAGRGRGRGKGGAQHYEFRFG